MKESKQSSNKIIVDNSDDDDISDNDSSHGYSSCDKYTNTEFEKQCDLLLKQITNNYRQQRDDIRNLVRLHRKEIKNATKNNKKNKKRQCKDKSGFTKPSVIPDKLAEYVGREKGSIMSRTELTGLICEKFKENNLYLEKDKRVIIPDKEVKKLFNLSDSALKSENPKDENGLNFYNLQKHIAKCYKDFEETKLMETQQLENNKAKKNVLNMAK